MQNHSGVFDDFSVISSVTQYLVSAMEFLREIILCHTMWDLALATMDTQKPIPAGSVHSMYLQRRFI